MQPMNMETHRCIMPVSGDKTKWLRCVCSPWRWFQVEVLLCSISPILFSYFLLRIL